MRRYLENPVTLATAIFVVTWVVYAAMIPTIMHTWKVTGDEPHYLLAAHSLVHDGDLDLRNNYQAGHHRDFYPHFLNPHVRQQPDGSWLLAHDIGLPVAIAPAYAVGGRLAVMRLMAVLGALLAAEMYILAWQVSLNWWASALAATGLALSAPLSLYVFQVYPELLGGLITVSVLRRLLFQPYPTLGPILPLFFLPWLSGRFAVVVLVLVGVAAWRGRARRGFWVPVMIGGIAALTIYTTVNVAYFGGPTPSATPAGNAVAAGFTNAPIQQVGRGLAAWLFDQQRGLLVYGPVLLVAIVGLPHLWNLKRWDGVLLCAPLVATWILASIWGGFYVGWEMSARFLIIGVPALAGAAAAALSRIRRIAFWPIAAGALTLSLFNTVIIGLAPAYAFHESPIKFYEEATRWQLRQFLPALGTRHIVRPPDGQAAWMAGEGESGYLVQTVVDTLSIGYYVIRGQAQVDTPDMESPALVVDVYASESGIQLGHADIGSSQAAAVDVNVPFYNPYYDKWRFPLYLDVRTTGSAPVRLSWLLIEPEPVATYGRVAAWALLIGLLTVWFAWDNRLPAAEAEINP